MPSEGFEEDEFIDVHEGGELSWMQKISNAARLRGLSIEAHGDVARIIIGEGLSIDIGQSSGKPCVFMHIPLPQGNEDPEYIDELSRSIKKVYEIASRLGGPFSYQLDASLQDLGVVHIIKCFDNPWEMADKIERVINDIF